MKEEFNPNVFKKERPIRRILEIEFEHIVKNGLLYDFYYASSFICTLRREVFNEKQRSLFDSLAKFPIGDTTDKTAKGSPSPV